MIALLLLVFGLPAAVEARTVTVKVYLADFNDIPRPERYTPAYVRELFFGLGSPRQTPEGKPLGGSVREYFRDVSRGRLDIEGEVADWVRIPRDVAKVPHWHSGMKPFGESWPVIVAETLRANRIGGDEARDQVRLSDGRRPDLLVFLNTDWGIGGVNRGWGQLRDVLGKMKLSELWDEGWSRLPAPYSCFSLTIWRKAPQAGVDGTIEQVPHDAVLEMFPLSIMMHEMGHQLAGWPDLYTPSYAPWGVFDLMGGPAAHTHYPMTVSAFLRVRSGWMAFTDLPRRDHLGLVLRPLETAEEALRLPQGPGQESLIVENRQELHYPRDYSQPPEDRGQRLLVYRVDPAGRRRTMSSGRPVKRLTTMVRRGGSYGEVWGGPAHTSLTAETSPSSRNALGELWWELREMAPQPDRSVRLDLLCRAMDLTAAMRPGGTGQVPLPPAGPRRLYLRFAGDDVAEAVSAGRVTAPPGRSRGLVAELPAGAAAVDWSLPAGALVQEAWLVGLPETVATLDAATWQPGAPPEPATTLLADGWWYGPHTRRLAIDGGTTWRATWPVDLPTDETVLRGLCGWSASSAVGARATVGIKLTAGDRSWTLMEGLQLARAEGDADPPAVLEIGLPSGSRGQAGRLLVEVVGSGDGKGELALAGWQLTR